MQRLFKIALVLGAIMAWSYFYYPSLSIIYKDKAFNKKVCNSAISYTIVSMDKGFNLTKENFSKDLKEATEIWENVQGVDLFTEVPKGGDISVILKYDDRQKITDQMGGLSQIIDSDNQQIELQKLNYKQLESEYNNAKSSYEYSLKKYYALRDAGSQMSQQVEAELKNNERRLNDLAARLNGYADTINSEVQVINTKINSFNSLGNIRGESFNEGEYVREGNSRTIYVYEFANHDKLVRLLAHEFGHALELEHVSGKDSILNEINGSINLKPTKEDISEFNRVCNDV